jgi:hypothetical protein
VSVDDRSKLAAEQAALVESLAGRSPAPTGFNAEHVATAAASLLAKRRRGVEKTWPGLAASLGDRFHAVFAEYASACPLPADGSHADGRHFARCLRRRDLLDDDGRLQLMLAAIGRWRRLGVTYLPGRRELVIAISTFSGTKWTSIRMPRFRRTQAPEPFEPAVLRTPR